ncbi:hypothetical protein MP638_005016 [Amoeboaphelidium occidentale]|nr:hypothetical protein MP638_005016 [Amoeboaphelidium occidentale]
MDNKIFLKISTQNNAGKLFLSVPYYSYLYFLNSSVCVYFSNFCNDESVIPSNLWYSLQEEEEEEEDDDDDDGTLLLQFNVPIGVLYDLHNTSSDKEKSIFRIRANFTTRPRELVYTAESLPSFIINSMKQSSFLYYNSSDAFSTNKVFVKKGDYDSFFTSIQSGGSGSGSGSGSSDKLQEIKRELYSIETIIPKSLCFRVYYDNDKVYQGRVDPNWRFSVRDYLESIKHILQLIITENIGVVKCCGVSVPLDTPLVYLQQHFSLVDNFVYLILLNGRKLK